MRTVKKLVALVFFGSLLAAHGTGLRASDDDDFDTFWCDEPSYQQEGAVCLYSSSCGFDGTPGTEYAPYPYENPTDYDSSLLLCNYDQYGINQTDVENEVEFFCHSYANFRGDAYGYVESWGLTHGPYYTVITEEFAGYCEDGEFTCNFQLEATCP